MIKLYLFKKCILNDTWSFKNHSKMQIWPPRNIFKQLSMLKKHCVTWYSCVSPFFRIIWSSIAMEYNKVSIFCHLKTSLCHGTATVLSYKAERKIRAVGWVEKWKARKKPKQKGPHKVCPGSTSLPVERILVRSVA